MKIGKVMKASSKLLAILASSFLLFGTISCSSDDDEEPGTVSPTSQPENGGTDAITLDGTAYATIQAALDAISDTGSHTIKVPAGVYNEMLYYNGSATVILSGQGTAQRGTDVVIKYSNSDNTNKMKNLTSNGPTSGYLRSVARFDGSANVVLENLTIQNTYSRSEKDGSNTQAEALYFNSTGNLAAYNCSFKSHQDTIQTEGKSWFYNCYVEGDVDFTWIEHSAEGSVALYEKCTLKAICDDGTEVTARFAAPRLIGTTSNIGKGEVFLNSEFTSDVSGSGSFKGIYLARSVASGTDVDQAAFINCSSTMTNLTEPWEKTPAMKTGVPRTIIGWKMDAATASAINYTSTLTGNNSDILTDTQVSKEFSGRRAILNRVYNTTAGKYKKDYDSYWDVDSLISSRSWTVDTDSSSVIQNDETESTVVTYTFNTETVDGITANGFAIESGKSHWIGQSGNTITVPVTGKCLVKVIGYYSGNGTIGFDGQGDALFAFNNNTTSSTLERTYMNYTGAGNVVITATAKTYITKIIVEYDDSLAFVPVTNISISAKDDATSVVGKKTLQLSYTLTPLTPTNDDVVWSVDNEDVATIDQTGLLTAKDVSEESSVVVTCKSKDANAVEGTKTITVLIAESTSFDISWLDSEAHCEPTALDATNGNEDVATGASGTLSDVSAWPEANRWHKDMNRKTAGVGCVVVTTSDDYPVPAGYDTFYVDFPITAKVACAIESVTLGGANWGTGNIKSQISYKRANDDSFTVVKTDIATRSVTTMTEVPTCITISANETITLRIAAGAGSVQKGGRSPGIPTVIVSGSTAPEKGGTRTYSMASYYDSTNLVSSSLSSDSVKNLTSEDGSFTLKANSFNGTQHGVVMNGSTFTVKVIPGSVVTMAGCAFGNAGSVTVTSDADDTLSATVEIATGTENVEYSYTYSGSVMANLTFTYPNTTNYLHWVKVQD